MKISRKDLLILIVPVVIMLLLLPVLPDRIPMQWNIQGGVNWYLDKRLSFLLGLIPFILYKLWQNKYKKK